MQRAPGYSAIPLRTLHLGMMHSQKGSQIAESSWDQKMNWNFYTIDIILIFTYYSNKKIYY